MRKTSPKKILAILSMGSPAGSRQLAGVFRFAANHASWDIMLARYWSAEQIVREIDSGAVHGIITSRNDTEAERAAILRARTCQVRIDGRESDGAAEFVPRFGNVRSDDRRAGMEGARHLLSLGRMRAYGYIPFADGQSRWSRLREEGCRAVLSERGLALTVFDQARERLGVWLQRLPKPAAVMAASDDTASQALILCRQLKIAVPRQLVLLGHDDDSLICDNCRPRLSSVGIGHEAEGFAAAQMLDRLMRHPNRPIRDVLIPPGAVMVRETTRPVRPAANLIDRALTYIRKNAADGISVDDVAHHLNVSRRLLYLRFGELLGRSVLDVMTECRIDLLKSRLASSSDRIAPLSLACGFPSINHAKRVFRAVTGLTMREWRAAAQFPKGSSPRQ